MDELALVRDFRLEDAALDGAREAVRARVDAFARRRRRRRHVVLALALAGAVIVASGATYAVAQALHRGDPAPKEVREQPARFGHAAELIPVPHPDEPQLQGAKVVGVLDSSAGKVYMFGSRNDRGSCASVWLEGDRGYQGRLNMTSACGSPTESMFAYGSSGTFRGHRAPKLFFGRAKPGVARVSLTIGGRRIAPPLWNRWFLAEVPADQVPDDFDSYAVDGRRLEHHPFGARLRCFLKRTKGCPVPRRNGPPHLVTRSKLRAQISARDGETIRLFVAHASDGGFCQIVRSDRRPSNFGCSVRRPAPRGLGVEAMNFGGAPGGVLLLVGPAGSDIAALKLRYQDGHTEAVPLHAHWALYEIPRSAYAAGHRPKRLVALDSSGTTVTSKSFPWR